MTIEFIDIIGWINNDSGIPGKAILFKIVEDSTEFILFVHKNEKSFISINSNEWNKEEILSLIFSKYTLEQLLEE